MRAAAENAGVTVAAPADINSAEGIELLKSFAPDLLMVCDYGQILSKAALATAPLGGINLHGSLLPKYRGAAPVHWAIYHGDEVTGVSVIHMTPRLDGGPILTTRELAIDSHDTTETLEPRLAEIGVEAVLESIEMLAQWNGEEAIGQVQQAKLVTKAPRLKKADGEIDWSQSATQIRNQIRAFQPWPGSYTFFDRPNGKELRLAIHKVEAFAGDSQSPPGLVLQAEGDELTIACGTGNLKIITIQPAGKRAMAANEFLNGGQLSAGDRLRMKA